jgi:hypothetical protein
METRGASLAEQRCPQPSDQGMVLGTLVMEEGGSVQA